MDNCSEHVDNDYFHVQPGLIYIENCVPGPGMNEDDFDSFLNGCSCTSACNLDASSKCVCLERNIKATNRQLSNLDKLLFPLFECNSSCKCPSTCPNKKSINGPISGLKVVNMGPKGFGVITTNRISRGCFICEYSGEMIGIEEAKNRFKLQSWSDHNYIMIIREFLYNDVSNNTIKNIISGTVDIPQFDSDNNDLKLSQIIFEKHVNDTENKDSSLSQNISTTIKNNLKTQDKSTIVQQNVPNSVQENIGKSSVNITVIDATVLGNIGRYINHSCQPNLCLVPVRSSHAIPVPCLHALRDIEPGEELTYNYYSEALLGATSSTSNCRQNDGPEEIYDDDLSTNSKSEHDVSPGKHLGAISSNIKKYVQNDVLGGLLDGTTLTSKPGQYDSTLEHLKDSSLDLTGGENDTLSDRPLSVFEHRNRSLEGKSKKRCLCASENCCVFLPSNLDFI